MAQMLQTLAERQFSDTRNGENGDGNEGYGYGSYPNNDWWWTPSGIATRYGIVAALFVVVIGFFAGSWLHLRSRTKKGLPPLAYHRWMNRPRTQSLYAWPRRAPDARYNRPSNNQSMDTYAPPPPAYHTSEAPPPTYQPPPGATKAMADQNFQETNRGEGSTGAAQV